MIKQNFAIGDYLVFPKYGVGKVYEMLVINFDKSKMILRFLKESIGNMACRSLSTKTEMD